MREGSRPNAGRRPRPPALPWAPVQVAGAPTRGRLCTAARLAVLEGQPDGKPEPWLQACPAPHPVPLRIPGALLPHVLWAARTGTTGQAVWGRRGGDTKPPCKPKPLLAVGPGVLQAHLWGLGPQSHPATDSPLGKGPRWVTALHTAFPGRTGVQRAWQSSRLAATQRQEGEGPGLSHSEGVGERKPYTS